MGENLDRVIKAFEAKGQKVTRHPSGCLTNCPDREDNHASLTFGEDENGGVWFKDKAGKSGTESILRALNLGREVLRNNGHNNTNGYKSNGNGPRKSSEATRLDWSNPDAIYEYPNEHGERHYRVLRKNFINANGEHDKSFLQQHWTGQKWKGGRGNTYPVPYRLIELMAADSDRWVCLCEGEKDASNLAVYDQVTTALAGGALNTKDLVALVPHVKARKVAIFQHNDSSGEKWATEAARTLYPVADEVRVITPSIGGWDDYEHQDPSDYIEWMKKEGFDIGKALEIMIGKALAWQPSKESETLPESPEPESEPESNEPPALIFQPLTFQQLLSLPPKEWLIKDIIGPGDLGMIFGDSGTGKTFLAIDLIMSAITGLTWARHFEVTEPLSVAYCTNEGLSGLPDRFRAAQQWYQASDEALERLTFYPMLPQLFDANAALYISRFVRDYKAVKGDRLDLLFIDTLDNASLGSKENDNSDASVIADATRIARDALGCATMLMHHAGKSGEYRGASAYKGDADIMIKVERKSEESPYIEFSCYKSKDAEKFKPLVFTLHLPTGANSCVVSWQGLASENLGKTNELLAAMEEMPGQRLTAKQWGEAIGVVQNHAIAILNGLHKQDKVERELQYADKKKSSRNPFVYYVQP